MSFEGGFCATLFRTARNSLILNGEMSEWSIEHAWKRFRRLAPSNTETSLRVINSTIYTRKMLSRCDAVNVGIPSWFWAHLTQFLHNSALHLTAYPAMFFVRFQRFLVPGPDEKIALLRATETSVRNTRAAQPIRHRFGLIEGSMLRLYGEAWSKRADDHERA